MSPLWITLPSPKHLRTRALRSSQSEGGTPHRTSLVTLMPVSLLKKIPPALILSFLTKIRSRDCRISGRWREPVTDDMTSLRTSSTRFRSLIRRSASLLLVISQQVISISPVWSRTGTNLMYFCEFPLLFNFLTNDLSGPDPVSLKVQTHLAAASRRTAGSGYTRASKLCILGVSLRSQPKSSPNLGFMYLNPNSSLPSITTMPTGELSESALDLCSSAWSCL